MARRTDEERRTLLKLWRKSGKSAKVFADENRISVPTLYAWRAKLEKTDPSDSDRESNGSNRPIFSQIRMSEEQARSEIHPSPPIAFVVGSMTVLVPPTCPSQTIRFIVEALYRC